MPGYIIHLAAAKELQPFLEKHQILKTEKDINSFLVSCCDRYPHLIHTPAGIGYLFHLYVDYLFYQEYWSRHILLTDSDHNLQIRKEKIDLAILLDFNKTVSGKTFFIEKPLYNDYTIINAILEDRYQLTYDFAPVENPGISEVDYSRIGEIRRDIERYSSLSRQASSHETRVLKVEPLLKFIHTTAPRFINDYIYFSDFSLFSASTSV